MRRTINIWHPPRKGWQPATAISKRPHVCLWAWWLVGWGARGSMEHCRLPPPAPSPRTIRHAPHSQRPTLRPPSRSGGGGPSGSGCSPPPQQPPPPPLPPGAPCLPPLAAPRRPRPAACTCSAARPHQSWSAPAAPPPGRCCRRPLAAFAPAPAPALAAGWRCWRPSRPARHLWHACVCVYL